MHLSETEEHTESNKSFLSSLKGVILGNRARTKISHSDESNAFLFQLIQRMGTVLATPEEKIIEPWESDRSVYYIIAGDCTVNVFDHNY